MALRAQSARPALCSLGEQSWRRLAPRSHRGVSLPWNSLCWTDLHSRFHACHSAPGTPDQPARGFTQQALGLLTDRLGLFLWRMENKSA